MPAMSIAEALLLRFVTRAEVAALGLSHLVGTPLLRAYMHGYFLHQRLWQRARTLAQPLAPAALRQQRISERLEAERASRITLVKKLPKVPPACAVLLRHDRGVCCKLLSMWRDGDQLLAEFHCRSRRCGWMLNARTAQS